MTHNTKYDTQVSKYRKQLVLKKEKDKKKIEQLDFLRSKILDKSITDVKI